MKWITECIIRLCMCMCTLYVLGLMINPLMVGLIHIDLQLFGFIFIGYALIPLYNHIKLHGWFGEDVEEKDLIITIPNWNYILNKLNNIKYKYNNFINNIKKIKVN